MIPKKARDQSSNLISNYFLQVNLCRWSNCRVFGEGLTFFWVCLLCTSLSAIFNQKKQAEPAQWRPGIFRCAVRWIILWILVRRTWFILFVDCCVIFLSHMSHFSFETMQRMHTAAFLSVRCWEWFCDPWLCMFCNCPFQIRCTCWLCSWFQIKILGRVAVGFVSEVCVLGIG